MVSIEIVVDCMFLAHKSRKVILDTYKGDLSRLSLVRFRIVIQQLYERFYFTSKCNYHAKKFTYKGINRIFFVRK